MRAKQLLVLLVAGSIMSWACSGASDDGSTFLVPCDDPAPLTGTPAPSGSFTVSLHDDADADAESARLASTCGFTVNAVLQFGHGFSAVLDIVELGCVRCDEVVTAVTPNVPLFPLE